MLNNEEIKEYSQLLKECEAAKQDLQQISTEIAMLKKQGVEKLKEKATINGDKLTKNRMTILELMLDNPYITIVELAKEVGISDTSIMRNIDYMRGKYLRRVGADKNGFWEIIS